MLKILFKIVISLTLFLNITYAQLYIDYSDIENNDIIDALAFNGIGIYKFNVDSIANKKNYLIMLEEYAGKDNLIKTDTLIGGKPFPPLKSRKNNKIRILTKVINESYKNVILSIKTPMASRSPYQITMNEKYARKHYWIEFEKPFMSDNPKIPLLFFGSEWDFVFQGRKTTRFCSLPRMPIDLSGDAILEMPHFYIISLLFY